MSSCGININYGETKSKEEIQRSIITKYRKSLWTPFTKGINEYELIKDGDVVAVCVSGGKDSLLLAKMMEELQKYSQIKFEVKYIAMDPGFNDENETLLKGTCESLGINVDVFKTQIFSIVDEIAKDYPCYMCARMRRGALYDYAQELGCNKIALGHHYDDFIETTMLNVLYAGNFKTMMPKLKASNYKGMELIRPLVYVREADIIRYTKANGIKAMNCGCSVAAGKTSSKRREVKDLLASLREKNEIFDKSIFAAGKNVNLSSIIGWEVEGEKHVFLERFDD